MKILVIDVGGTHVKVLVTGHQKRVEIPSGPKMTPAKMVTAVKAATAGWKYDVVSIGYPGPVVHGRPFSKPHHLGPTHTGNQFLMQAFDLVHQAVMAPLSMLTGIAMYKMVKWIERIEFVETEKTLGKGEGGKNEDDEYFDILPNF